MSVDTDGTLDVTAESLEAVAGAPPTPSAVGGLCRPPTASPLHDPATPYGQLGLAFKRAMVAVRRLRGRETHRSDQISYAQYGLLFGLAEVSERSARELADHTDLAPATVTQMLDHLEASGLVTRTRSEQDRRVVLTSLTAKGQQLVGERRAAMEPRWRAAIAQFSDEELLVATRVLNSLADYFDAMFEDGPVA